MDSSPLWFIGFAVLSLMGWALGRRTGQAATGRGLCVLAGSISLLVVWTWLMRNPAEAVRVLPVWLLSRIEGVGAVPLFFVVVGLARSWSRLPRQRRLTQWAAMLGVVYFLQGGWWMLQTTPTVGFATERGRGEVRQSQDFSCVPAACATALNQLGVYTTEAEMAVLTRTRPGMGSTTLRALDGVRQRLGGAGFTVELLEPDYEGLRRQRGPMLTPLQFEPTRRHMVCILGVEAEGLWVADPAEGRMYIPRDQFEEYYRYEVLVFRPVDGLASRRNPPAGPASWVWSRSTASAAAR